MVPGASVVTVQVPENAINNSVQGETTATATAKANATTLCVGPAGHASFTLLYTSPLFIQPCIYLPLTCAYRNRPPAKMAHHANEEHRGKPGTSTCSTRYLVHPTTHVAWNAPADPQETSP